MKVVLTLYVLVLGISSHARYLVNASHSKGNFLNEWVAEIPGGLEHAQRVAAQHEYTISRQLRSLEDHYVLERRDVPHRSRREANHHTRKLSEDGRVRFVEQQYQKFRAKRDFIDREAADEIAETSANLNDPYYTSQWYINPSSQETSRRNSGSYPTDLGVHEAWKRGFTGKGIVVTILDDGLESKHPDIQENYDSEASYDFNDNDHDPTPRYEITNENKHGTRCAGEVAMLANNNICGAGVAFNSHIGGVRMLDGPVTDIVEGDSIGFCQNYVDICSASWGPNDDGKTLEGPGLLAMKGLLQSIEKGRKGKGTIMVWAAGNGGRIGDNCNADGYTSSIYTLSVSSASQSGSSPWYSEKCASTLAATYSSGAPNEAKVVSTDLKGQCTSQHTGTSASAPLAAGMIALVLEANPALTWRDVQHLVVYTSTMKQLAGEEGWYKNGIGYCVNLRFGFGLMDAGAMVKNALPDKWEPVGPQKICRVEPASDDMFPMRLVSGSTIEVEIKTDGCEGQDNEIRYLEQLQVLLTLEYSRRGNIYAELESPSGTITPLMLERKFDKSVKGFVNWPLTTTHNWGEHPNGTWIFRIADRSGQNFSGELQNVTLILYGTKEQPFYQKRVPADCGDVGRYAKTPPPRTVEDSWQQFRGFLDPESDSEKEDVFSELLHHLQSGK